MSRTEYQILLRISQKILTKKHKIKHFNNLSKLVLKNEGLVNKKTKKFNFVHVKNEIVKKPINNLNAISRHVFHRFSGVTQ